MNNFQVEDPFFWFRPPFCCLVFTGQGRRRVLPVLRILLLFRRAPPLEEFCFQSTHPRDQVSTNKTGGEGIGTGLRGKGLAAQEELSSIPRAHKELGAEASASNPSSLEGLDRQVLGVRWLVSFPHSVNH